MASKYVRETKAGKSISAWVIHNSRGDYVATVQAHYADSGRVLVNVWQSESAYLRSFAAVSDGIDMKAEKTSRAAHDEYQFQYASAGGYGYDKTVAALSGLIIDGHPLTDHCGSRLPYPDGLDHFPASFVAPDGWSLANWRKEGGGWSDCYRLPGLDYLRAVGYRLTQAI